MNEQPKKRPEHSDSWDRTMFMLRRNRRNMIGLLLLCVVGVMIYYVATKPKEPTSAGTWRSTLGSDNDPAPDVSETGDNGSGDLTSQSDPNDSSESTGPQTRTTGGSEKTETLEDFLESASPSDLVEELLRLRTQKTGSLPVNFVTVQRRSTIAKHLLEMDVSEDKKLFAINDYIEAIIQLDAINQSGKLAADHVRDELIGIRDNFSDHTDDSIGAKASLAYVLIPIHDFFADKDEARLTETADLFDLHAPKILRHPDTTARFAKLAVDLYVESDYSDEHKALTTRLMKRMEKSEDLKIKEIARLLREQIYFAKSELGSLVERIEGGNTIARDNVQSLFEGLDANPSSRLEIYKVATNVIAEYHRLGHSEDADALINWLTTINQNNESKENREAVVNAITAFREIRKRGKAPASTPPAPGDQ